MHIDIHLSPNQDLSLDSRSIAWVATEITYGAKSLLLQTSFTMLEVLSKISVAAREIRSDMLRHWMAHYEDVAMG